MSASPEDRRPSKAVPSDLDARLDAELRQLDEHPLVDLRGTPPRAPIRAMVACGVVLVVASVWITIAIWVLAVLRTGTVVTLGGLFFLGVYLIAYGRAGRSL
jgi:hypothetical protein